MTLVDRKQVVDIIHNQQLDAAALAIVTPYLPKQTIRCPMCSGSGVVSG